MGSYGDVIEVWATDVADVGVAERYLENFANYKERGSMAWRCWQIGGSRCGNVTSQAFDAARGSGYFLDLLYGGLLPWRRRAEPWDREDGVQEVRIICGNVASGKSGVFRRGNYGILLSNFAEDVDEARLV